MAMPIPKRQITRVAVNIMINLTATLLALKEVIINVVKEAYVVKPMCAV